MADDSRKTAVCDRRDDSEEDQHNENQDDDDEVESLAVDEVKTLQRSRIGASIGAHSGDNSRDEVYVSIIYHAGGYGKDCEVYTVVHNIMLVS